MTRMAQIPIENNLWFDFRLECQRRSLRVAEVVPVLLAAQLATWAQEREAQAGAAIASPDSALNATGTLTTSPSERR